MKAEQIIPSRPTHDILKTVPLNGAVRAAIYRGGYHMLLRDLDAQGKKHFRNLLKGLLPSKLIPVCIDLVGIPADKPAHQITAKERTRLLSWLKDFRLEATAHRPFEEAIVTAGGVALDEIDPRTMESRLVKGLYFAGEVLDIDANTGGFNLQAAFSTGWVAGRAAAQQE